LKDDSHFFNLAITGDGRAAVTKRVGDNFIDFIDNSVIRGAVALGNTTNSLRIRKVDDRISFFINDQQIYEMPFEWPDGVRFGFVLYNRLNLEIDDFVITTSRSIVKTTPCTSYLSMTLVEHQRLGELCLSQGYALASVSVFGAADDLRVAAVWQKA